MPVFIHHAEDANLVRLEALVHGAVRMLPIADDTQTLEALHLPLNILLGVLVAGGAEIGNGHGLVVELLLLDDGALNGHTVVIPAGDIGGVVSAHGGGAGDKVLDGLVERVAHMDITVGEGRAIVQIEEGLALVFLQKLVVDVLFFPLFEHIRLTFGKTRAHGKVSLWQIECCVKIL